MDLIKSMYPVDFGVADWESAVKCSNLEMADEYLNFMKLNSVHPGVFMVAD